MLLHRVQDLKDPFTKKILKEICIYNIIYDARRYSQTWKKGRTKNKLHKKYQKEKLQNYENNDVRSATIEQLIVRHKEPYRLAKNAKNDLIIKRNKASLDHYYKNKNRLDIKRKELYQQNKEQLSQQTRVLKFCKKK